MIVVSAASGALGRLVIDRLRTRAEVVAAVRDTASTAMRSSRGSPAES
ncbi:hypothetical protein AB0L53_56745 [Nonomuraea sp. NPDC052129]